MRSHCTGLKENAPNGNREESPDSKAQPHRLTSHAYENACLPSQARPACLLPQPQGGRHMILGRPVNSQLLRAAWSASLECQLPPMPSPLKGRMPPPPRELGAC